jgi:pseudouridine synthase
MKIVLQKFIAESGYGSRRKAEELIRQGKVKINGRIAELGERADENDEVMIGGKKIDLANKKIYIKLNKPKDYVCTSRKFKGEKNVFDLLTSPYPSPSQGDGVRLFIVGRLDKDSRGLVLLTNDGDLTQKLTHPKYEHEKEYVINVKCQISNFKLLLEKLLKGIDIGEGDGVVKAKEARYLGDNNFKLVLTEGKKRQIRRMFKTLNCEIADLVRVRIGCLKLEDLKEGEWRYLKENEIVKLLNS